MADIIGNINLRGVDKSNQAQTVKQKTKPTTKTDLTMDDFLALLVKQLQNQDMMNPMDEAAFMNQMTQMATIQAMNTFTDISVTTYAASLVGKEITVAEKGTDGKISEVVGVVTGAAVYGGEQVVFINGKSYYLTQVMAVGKLPPPEEKPDEKPDEKPEETTPPTETTPPAGTTP